MFTTRGGGRAIALAGFVALTAIARAQTPLQVTTPQEAWSDLAFDDALNTKFEAAGGVPPYRWSLAAGNPPEGLAIDRTGEVSGTVARALAFDFTIRVTDADGAAAVRRYAGTIYPVPRPVPPNLPVTFTCIYMPKPAWPSHQFGELRVANEKNSTKNAHFQRMPVLGYYRGDDPEVLDWQIKFAVDRGIGCFITGDFWIEDVPGPTYTTTIDALLRARYSSHIAFALTVPHATTRDANAPAARRVLLEQVLPYYARHYFTRPNYMKVDGKPVLHVQNWNAAFRLTDPAAIATLLKEADEVIAASGGGEEGAYWMTADIGASPGEPGVNFARAAEAGFDAVHPYNGTPYLWPAGPGFPIPNPDPSGNAEWPPGVPYSVHRDGTMVLHQQAFAAARETGVKFVTAPATSFDYRYLWWIPRLLYFSNERLEDYATMLRAVRATVAQYPDALPTCTNTGKPLVGLGPWNEITESGIIEPCYSQFNADGGGAGRNDPFIVADTAAAIFGATTRAKSYDPGDHSGPWPFGRSEWTFSTSRGTGFEEWGSPGTAHLSAGHGDLEDTLLARGIFGPSAWIVLQTPVRTPLAPYTRVHVLFHASANVTAPPRDLIGLHLTASNYSETAHQFGSPPEPHRTFAGPVFHARPTPTRQEGVFLVSFDIPISMRPLTTRMLELRFGVEHLDHTYPGIDAWVAIRRVWFE